VHAPRWVKRNAGDGCLFTSLRKSGARATREQLILQKLTALVERAKLKAGSRKGFGRGLLAVTIVNTSTISPPASRTASTAFSAEPPVVVTSSTNHDALALQALALGQAFHRQRAPCSFGFLRTKNAAIGVP